MDPDPTLAKNMDPDPTLAEIVDPDPTLAKIVMHCRVTHKSQHLLLYLSGSSSTMIQIKWRLYKVNKFVVLLRRACVKPVFIDVKTGLTRKQ